LPFLRDQCGTSLRDAAWRCRLQSLSVHDVHSRCTALDATFDHQPQRRPKVPLPARLGIGGIVRKDLEQRIADELRVRARELDAEIAARWEELRC
jgi:hypothetical protein